ncbi:MAG: NHLP leader peptide family natural product precursor [Bryobacterales bacterium]|nr:NHLP leader peptide family natural product precursor [Bryobacterales bacterium]
MDQDKFDDVMSRVTAKAWADPAYKARLMSDPASVLRGEGLDLGDRKVYAHENTNDALHYVLPPKPEGMAEPVEAPGHRNTAPYTIHEVEI